jgi:hypothetical protein
MSHEEEKILLFDTLSIAIKRSEKEMKFWEIFLRPFSLFCCGLLLLLYCRPLSFYFPSKFISPFFLIRDFPHVECVFLFFLLYDPFHRHNNNTHSAAAARVCWASFLVIVEVGRRFFVRFLCGTRRLRPAQNARTQSRVKMRTNGNMHNVKQTSNTHTIHAERRISCDVVGVSKKLGICSAALLALIPVISSSTNGEKICRVGDR